MSEQKNLMLAQESEDEKSMQAAIAKCIEDCTFAKVNAWELPAFDVEYIFLKVRSKSVGETVELGITCPDDNETVVQKKIDLSKIECTMHVGHTNEIQLTENWGRPWREKGWRPADENWETWMCDECRKSKFYICNHHVNYRYSEIAWQPQHGCFNKVSQEESLPLGWGISKPLFEITEEALGDDTIMYYCPEHANNFFNQHVPEWEGPRIYSGGGGPSHLDVGMLEVQLAHFWVDKWIY